MAADTRNGVGPWAAVDPGRSKCGLVLTDSAGSTIVAALVLPPESCWQRLQHWQRTMPLRGVILGDGTGSQAWQARLRQLGAPVLVVVEAGTTLAARRRYWELLPPQGWRRLLPEGLRLPPRDWDDVVAQLLLERHLGHPLSRRPDADQVGPIKTSPAP
jgi:hypothetical protein